MSNRDIIKHPRRGDTWETSIGRIVYRDFTPASETQKELAKTLPISIDGCHAIYVNGNLRLNIGGFDFAIMMHSLDKCEYAGNIGD